MQFRRILLVLICSALAGCGASQHSSQAPSPVTTSASLATQNHVHAIAVLPRNPNALYLAGRYRLAKSNDGGRKWHTLTGQMMLSMALDPLRPSTIYAVSSTRGLIKSTDGGRHWSSLVTAGVPFGVIGLVFDPATRVVLAYGSGIYRSTDGGHHWSSHLPSQSISSMAVGAGGTAYAASGAGLYVSHDSGMHWKSIRSIGNQPIIQVVASGRVAYAVSPVGLFKSSNNGQSWRPIASAPTGLEFLGVSPTNANEVFGEIGRQGFVASDDGGASWHPANKGIRERNFASSTIVVAPSSPNVVYTGSWGIHFYASRDGGRHWSQTASLVH